MAIHRLCRDVKAWKMHEKTSFLKLLHSQALAWKISTLAENYLLKLEHFEGPLDLLLHLIRKKEVDILAVDLSDLASQYLSYLRTIKFANLSIASAFLGIAATLCEIKSLQLVNAEQNGDADDSDAESLEEVEETLRRRLLIYQGCKEAAASLEVLRGDAGLTLTNSSESKRYMELFGDTTAPLCGHAPALLILYENLLAAVSGRKPELVRTKREQIALEEIIDRLEAQLATTKLIVLQDLYRSIASRYELIAHILAFLQLAREVRELCCHQNALFAPIYLSCRPDNATLTVEDHRPGEALL